MRNIAKSSNVSLGAVSRIIDAFPFMDKRGNTKNMRIKFNQPTFEQWIRTREEMIVQDVNNDCEVVDSEEVDCSSNEMIVQNVNNDCSLGEPRSIKEEVIEEITAQEAMSLISPGVLGENADGAVSKKVHIESNEEEYSPASLGVVMDSISACGAVFKENPVESNNEEYSPASLEAVSETKPIMTKEQIAAQTLSAFDAVFSKPSGSISFEDAVAVSIISTPAVAASGAESSGTHFNPSPDVPRTGEGKDSTVPASSPGEVVGAFKAVSGETDGSVKGMGEVDVPLVKEHKIGIRPEGKTVYDQITDLEKRFNKKYQTHFDSHGGIGHSFGKGLTVSMFDKNRNTVIFYATTEHEMDLAYGSWSKLKLYCKSRGRAVPRACIYVTCLPETLLTLE